MGFGWRTRSAAVYGIAVQVLLVLLLAFAIVRFTGMRHLSAAKSDLTHYLFAERDRMADLVDEETGVRGYVATGNPLFLDPFNGARARTDGDSQRARAYYSTGTASRADIVLFDRQQRALQAYFDGEISLVQSGRRAAALARLPQGKMLFDALRATHSRIQLAADKSLDVDYTRSNSLYAGTIGVAFALEIFVLFSFVALVVIVRHANAAHQTAHEDMLTGLGNRRHAVRVLRRVLAQRTAPVGILYLDLDGFKIINDNHGHASGDDILIQVAKRLKRQLRGADAVARLGGDEFLCILSQGVTAQQMSEIAQRVHHALTRPYSIDDDVFVVGCSVGWVLTPAEMRSADEALAMADAAMYEAKNAGGGVSARLEDLRRETVERRAQREPEPTFT